MFQKTVIKEINQKILNYLHGGESFLRSHQPVS
jgi:hypothetical protein